jgi:hypothetical protein
VLGRSLCSTVFSPGFDDGVGDRAGFLPGKHISTEIWVSRVKRADKRAMNDMECVICEYLVAQSMTNMLGEAHKMSGAFLGSRGKLRLKETVVNLLPEVKAEESTDIDSEAMKELKRNGVKGGTV